MAFSLLWRAGSIKFFSLASQIETSQYSDYLSTSLAHKLNAGHKSSSSQITNFSQIAQFVNLWEMNF